MNITEKLHDLVADEPPYRLDPDAAASRGRRRKHRRTAALSGCAAVAVGVAAAAVLWPADAWVQDTKDTLVVAGPGGRLLHVAATSQSELERVVRAHTPAEWDIRNAQTAEPDGFLADVDDGDGASRLYLGVSPSPGSLQQHPCSDPEFALGGPCVEADLDADTRLITRGPSSSGPVTTSVVVVVHRDGSGVHVESGNATWPVVDLQPGQRVTPEEKRRLSTPSVNRALPVYSVEQLVEIVEAVDAAR